MKHIWILEEIRKIRIYETKMEKKYDKQTLNLQAYRTLVV